MSSAATGGLPRDARVGLVVLGLLVVALVLLVVGVRYWTDDSPRAALPSAAATTSQLVSVPAGQAFVRTEVLPSGELVVTQWIHSKVPLDGVVLSPPGTVGTGRVLVDRVRVRAGDSAVAGAEQILGQPRRYSFPAATSIQITYHLTGAVERSSSAPGRALARITSLDVSYEPASELVTRSITADEVLSLACAGPGGSSTQTPCGARVAQDEWQVELAGDRAADRVIAQVTLY